MRNRNLWFVARRNRDGTPSLVVAGDRKSAEHKASLGMWGYQAVAFQINSRFIDPPVGIVEAIATGRRHG